MAGTSVASTTSVTTSSAVTRLLVGTHPRRTLARAVLLVVIAYGVFGHLLIPVRGQGPSMWPTLRDGQLVLVNRMAYWIGEPRRGDVVALEVAGGRVMYIKRIIGLPGERVRIERGTVVENGRALDEPNVRWRGPWHVGEIRLPEGEYLMIGDNRAMSQRSHDFGRARRERVLGRVLAW
jgi:signal peptidase I